MDNHEILPMRSNDHFIRIVMVHLATFLWYFWCKELLGSVFHQDNDE